MSLRVLNILNFGIPVHHLQPTFSFSLTGLLFQAFRQLNSSASLKNKKYRQAKLYLPEIGTIGKALAGTSIAELLVFKNCGTQFQNAWGTLPVSF